jgi:hypothetical protein
MMPSRNILCPQLRWPPTCRQNLLIRQINMPTMSLAGAERVLAARAPAEFDPESISSRFSYHRQRYGRK